MKRAAILMMLTAVAFAAREDVLMEADRQFCKATTARKADGFLSFFDEQGVILPKDGEPVVGKAAMRPIFEKRWSAPGYSLEWTPLKAVLAKSGELGYTYGRYVRKYVKDGQAVTETGKYVTTWKRQEDGSWKILLDMGN